MLIIFISALFFAGLLAGWGAVCVRFIHIEADNLWLHPFLGMFAAGTAFSAVSMFLPLNDVALAVFALIGLAGLPSWGRSLHSWRSGNSREVCGVFLVCVLAVTLLLAARCAYVEWPGPYDTDLYHANTVRWLNEYGTPPGLANLHARLGNNSVWLTLAALLDNGYWDNRTAWLMPVLLALCVAAYLLYNVLFSTVKTVRVFCGVMLFFIISMSITKWKPTLDYDLPAMFVNVIVFAECLARAEDGWKIKTGQASLILCLAALAFAIKPLAGASVLFAVGIALYGLKKNRLFSITHVFIAFFPAVAAGIIWMTRNSLLSGYPLFPLPLSPLPLDWTVPKSIVVGIYTDIIGWARSPGPGHRESLNNWSWLVPWLERRVASRSFWFVVGLPLLAAIPLWIKRLSNKQNLTPIFFCIWASLCLCYWFFSAPDLRFGVVFFQVFFALGLAFAMQQALWLETWETHCVNFLQNRRAYHALSAVFLIITVSICIGQLHTSKRSVVHVGSIPSRELLSRPLDTSVAPPVLLFFPANGDQCGNSPLPCAPYDNLRLRLRVPGDLGGGFYSE